MIYIVCVCVSLCVHTHIFSTKHTYRKSEASCRNSRCLLSATQAPASTAASHISAPAATAQWERLYICTHIRARIHTHTHTHTRTRVSRLMTDRISSSSAAAPTAQCQLSTRRTLPVHAGNTPIRSDIRSVSGNWRSSQLAAPAPAPAPTPAAVQAVQVNIL